jgi:hypothetical protein
MDNTLKQIRKLTKAGLSIKQATYIIREVANEWYFKGTDAEIDLHTEQVINPFTSTESFDSQFSKAIGKQ